MKYTFSTYLVGMLVLLSMSLGPLASWAMQDPPALPMAPSAPASGPVMLPIINFDGEEMLWVLIPEVRIERRRVFSSKEAETRYLRLRNNVLKVLPYAHFAKMRYEQLHRDLAMTDSRREQRRLVRNCEKEIKDMFNREVKKLTVSQGKILIKLIDRQTGLSSYDVVRELRGNFTAFFYQSVAKVFGHNLKSEYDPQEDIEIEFILRSLHYDGAVPSRY